MGTAKTYLAILSMLGKDINPLTITEKDVLTIKRWLLKRFTNLAPKTKIVYHSALKSWLEHKEIKAELGIKLPNGNSTPTLANEKIPEKFQIREVLLSLGPRARTIATLMCFSGLRFESIHGITLSDITDR